ncbi:MAG: hypothetical protein WKG01_12400 [Kofleriaceae bacterium]
MAHTCTTDPCPICDATADGLSPARLAQIRAVTEQIERERPMPLVEVTEAIRDVIEMVDAIDDLPEPPPVDAPTDAEAIAQLGAQLVLVNARLDALESAASTIDRLEAQLPTMTPEQLDSLHEVFARMAAKLAELKR